GACAIVYCGLRQPTGNRIALAHRRGDICGTHAKQLLPRIQITAAPRCKRPRGRDALDVGEQEASSGEGNNSLDIAQPQRGTVQEWQPSRDLAGCCKPECRQPQNGCSDYREGNDSERCRFPRQQTLAS